MFHVEPYLKTFELVTICVKSGLGLRPARRGAILGGWVLTSLGYRMNARRDSAHGPRPAGSDQRPAGSDQRPAGHVLKYTAPDYVHGPLGAGINAGRERWPTVQCNAAHGPGAQAHGARPGSAELGTRPTARERRSTEHGPPGAGRAVCFKGNRPWLTGPAFGRASKARKSKIKLPLSRVKIMYRDAGPVYAGEKKRPAEAGRKAKRAGLCALDFQAAARAQ